MRLLHLSDIHFGTENRLALDALDAYIALVKPDIGVVTGDLTLGGRRDEFVTAATWISRLNLPLILASGNHDVPQWNVWARLRSPFRRFEALQASTLRSYRDDIVQIHTLRTAQSIQLRLNWAHGAIRRRDLDDVLGAFGAKPPSAWSILACHHPLIDHAGQPVKGRTWNGVSALRQLEEARVNLILSGHVHVPRVDVHRGLAQQVIMVSAGTLSSRTRTVPASFNLLELTPSTIKIDIMEFVGGTFDFADRWTMGRPAEAGPTLEASLKKRD